MIVTGQSLLDNQQQERNNIMQVRDEQLAAVLAALPDDWKQPHSHYRGIIRPSGLQGCPNCPRRYLFSNRLRWGLRKSESSSALVIGTIVHRFMAGLYAGMSAAQVTDTLAAAVTPLIDEETDSKRRQNMLKEWNVARVMVDHWLLAYGHPNDHEIEVLAVEQTLCAPLTFLGKHTTSLIGTLDVALQNKSVEVWIMDHKTTGLRPSLFASGLAYDNQSRAYRELWNAAHPDTPAVGIIHNILMKPTIRLKKNQTYEEYYEEVGEWYESQAICDPGTAPFMKSYVRFLEPPLAECPEARNIVEAEARWCCIEPNLADFYRNRRSCYDYNRPCPYLDLCNTNPRAWATTLTDAQERKFQRLEPPLESAMKGHDTLAAGMAGDF